MPTMLIANRGEIAIRIARTARATGYGVVTAHSADDADAPHVAAGDRTAALPGEGPAAYLAIDAIIAAARAAGCDAIHPGYGFLSESAAFARACDAAGLTFVGPSAEALALFGNKAAAKALAREVGVPVLAEGEAALAEGAVMVKAVAGGGGRGIRIVRDAAALPAAIAAARAEAEAAFGDGATIVERHVARARHIEVQLAGDAAGAVVALGTRDCSIQRRHQKFVEVAPAQWLDPAMERDIVAAAVRLLSARRYVGLATAEFLVDLDRGDFAFLEVNPRLQVEHTVTEEVTGLDLVALQLRLSAGGAVPAAPETRGVAIELRVGAETLAPDGSVRAEVGTVAAWRAPGGPGVRVDAAVVAGMTVNPRFDPLLAKLVVRGADWPEALARAKAAAAECAIEGVATNLPLLRALLDRAAIDGVVETGWFDSVAGDFATVVDMADADPLAATAPLSGVVVAITVAIGDTVAAGAEVATVEALKMQHAVAAPVAGIVRAVAVAPGAGVAQGAPVVLLDPVDGDGAVVAAAAAADPDLIRPDLAEAIAARAPGLDANRGEAVARRHAKGQRTARENVADLFDPGSFVEYGALTIAAQRRRRDLADLIAHTPHDGLVGGVGTVNAADVGEERAKCLGLAYDYTVLAGTQGMWNHRKTDRLLAVAETQRLPVVFYTEGGGGRPGDVDALGVSGLDTPTFRSFAALSGKAVRIGITTGFCFAGNAVLYGCADITIATADAHIGMGGPAMIEGGGLGVFRPTEIGPVAVQHANGVVDLLVADEVAATAAAKRLLGFFQGRLPAGDVPDQRLLRHAVPENRLRVFDMRRAVAGLVDADTFVELRGGFAAGMVTGLARIDGRPVGILANDCRHLSGAIDSDGADKAARFMQLCDAFGLPIVSLIDTPGFMVGPEAEATAPVRHGSRMFLVAAQLSVPLFAVVVRKAYGLGAQAMAGGSLQANAFTVSWPTGEFGGMGLEGAVRLGYRRELEAIADPAAREARFGELVAASYDRGKAISVARVLEIDAVIDPADTRAWLRRGLASAEPRPSGRFVDAW
ncbi:carbamoyl-phosphate synthase large subunit [Sphingomonas sp. Leaf412]|uniref:acetyl-CoA carboxylase family protein n=1 Tax=Sphingomonas sp. Leaf412 TaxID=1736370 RepID=UPI0006F8659F|nr:carboxyl transferase domain-containing protein [Sphingomonas sp. Leaf412]KQT32951.1 carbamoyl-phosphate synthase large subunit [Sphingomonas sp. Leaf412]